MEYLYNQTGKVLQDYDISKAESDQYELETEVEPDEEEDEGFEESSQYTDFTVPTLDSDVASEPSASVHVRAPQAPKPAKPILSIPSESEYADAMGSIPAPICKFFTLINSICGQAYNFFSYKQKMIKK